MPPSLASRPLAPANAIPRVWALLSLLTLVCMLVPSTARADFTVTGVAAHDAALMTPWGGCSSRANLSIAYNGSSQGSTTCDPSTGAYTATVVSAVNDGVLAVYFDATGMANGARAVTYVRIGTSSGTYTNVHVVQSRVSIDTRSVALSTSTLATWDQGEAPNIPYASGTVDDGHILYFGAGAATITNNVTTSTPKLHLQSGAVVNSSSRISVRTGGIADCGAGFPHMRPICLEPGATLNMSNTVTYDVDTDSVVDLAPAYRDVSIAARSPILPRTLRFTAGTGPGQTMNALGLTVSDCMCDGEVELIGSQHDPSWNLARLILGRNAGFIQDGPGTLTITDYAHGAGFIDAPSMDMQITSTSGRSSFGPSASQYGGHLGQNQRWHLRSLTLASDMDRTTTSVAPTGMRLIDFSPGRDEWYGPISGNVSQDCCAYRLVGRSGANGGDWMVGSLPKGGGVPTTWTWNSGGSNVDKLANRYQISLPHPEDPGLPNVTRTLVVGTAGTNGGDWGIGVFDSAYQPDPRWLATANPGETIVNGVRTWDSGGPLPDTAVGAVMGTDATGLEPRLFVFGTAGINGNDWVVRSYDPLSGAFDQSWTWNSGGNQDDQMTLYEGGVLAGTVGTNGGDFALRTFDTTGADAGWMDGRSLAGGACVEETGNCQASAACVSPFGCRMVWNSGGSTRDVITAYADNQYNEDAISETGDPALDGFSWWCGSHVGGTTSSGGSTDWYVARICGSQLDPSFNGTGVVTYDSGGPLDDVPHGIRVRQGDVNVVGVAGINGGDAVWRRWDFDGDVDTSLNGTGSVITGGPGYDSFTALTTEFGGLSIGDNTIPMGTRGDSNGGEAAFGVYNYDGGIRDGSTTGATVFMPRPGPRGSVSRIQLEADLAIGSASGDGALFNLNHADMVFDVGGDVRINNTGWLRASTSSPLKIGGSLIVDGTFLHENGSVQFQDASQTSTIQLPPGTELGALQIRTPRKVVTLPNATTLVVDSLDLGGTSCTDRARLANTSGTTTAAIQAASATVTFADIHEVTTTSGLAAANSVGTGTTTGWTINPGGCGGLTPRAPSSLFTNSSSAAAQTSLARATDIATPTPWFSFLNRAGTNVDAYGTEVWSDVNDSRVHGLWHMDQSGSSADPNAAAGATGCGDLVPTANASWVPSRVGFGNALQVNGTAGSTATAAGTCAVSTSFTVSARVRLDPAAICATGTNTEPVIVRDAGVDRTFAIGVDCKSSIGSLFAVVKTNGSPARSDRVSAQNKEMLDRAWHHVAVIVDDEANLLTLVVDGEQSRARTSSKIFRSDDVIPVSALQPQAGCSSGCVSFMGQIDEFRVVSGARSVGEIRGFMRTGMPHGTRVWDADGAADVGIAFPGSATCSNGARCASVQYAGPASILRSGARWWVRSRIRDAGGSGPWSEWSRPDWFETAGSGAISVTLQSSSTLDLGTILAGEDISGEATVRVASSNEGYQLLVTDGGETTAAGGAYATMDDWTADPGSPSSWTTGTTSAFGMSLLSVNGAKLAAEQARWGPATAHDAYDDLKYVGLKRGAPSLIASRADATSPWDDVRVGFRVNASTIQRAGRYRGSIQFTVVANP